MKTAGSRETFELYGCVRIAPSPTSFGLPIFRGEGGSQYGQVVDELSDKISDFRPVDLAGSKVVALERTSLFRCGDNPAYCLLQADGLAEGGRLSDIKDKLHLLVDDESVGASLRIQSAALTGSDKERRLRRAILQRDPAEPKLAARAYNRSLGRILLWDKLIRAAKNEEVAERTLLLRPQIELDVSDIGVVTLDLGILSPSDYPTLNFSTLAASIEVEIGLTVPSNDEFGLEGDNEQVFSITDVELKLFLNRRFGPDARISTYTYKWTVDLLRDLGFMSLDQVAQAVQGYSDRYLSHVATGNLQGQTTRLEIVLLAAMGQAFIDRHPWNRGLWFGKAQNRMLSDMSKAGVPLGDYDPTDDATRGC